MLLDWLGIVCLDMSVAPSLGVESGDTVATVVNTKIAGIPCQVRLEYHQYYPGTRDTPDEPEGYSIEEVMDTRGRRAGWLRAKITEKDEDRIVGEAMTALNETGY